MTDNSSRRKTIQAILIKVARNDAKIRKQKQNKVELLALDPGIREAVRILRDSGIDTLSSCEGRRSPGYHPKRDGPHHGDWPYVILNGTTADAFMALGAVLRQGLPVRSIEQSWFVYPEAPSVPVGPQWRITFWEKHTPR